MAEVIRDHDNNYTSRAVSSTVGTIALVIAIAALVLAWVAYNRAGEDLENQVIQGVEQGIDATDDAAEEAGEAAQDGTDAVERGIDTGPDGVDDGAE